MKGFTRSSHLLSLCGLNCALCPMLLGGHCGGCGNGNQSCGIARCSLEHGGVEYCFECGEYPCEKYRDIDRYDSFITHRRQKADMERARNAGIDLYNAEQLEKARMLRLLLDNYNDGRRKSFYCLAVNLLELPELREALERIGSARRAARKGALRPGSRHAPRDSRPPRCGTKTTTQAPISRTPASLHGLFDKMQSIFACKLTC